jgi:hypothetical protein
MFIGHFALGFAAKRVEPKVSLGTAFLACQFLDLVWPVLVLAGLEQVRGDPEATAFSPLDFVSYPYSHSLTMTIVYGALFVVLFKLLGRGTRTALLVGGLVVSHWVLDFATHRPDLPLLVTDGPKVGLGLWNSVRLTLAVELGLFLAGVRLYMTRTRAENAAGSWGAWSLMVFLLLVYLASAFGPRPAPDTPAAAIAGPALAIWLLVVWGYWADRNRRNLCPPGSS